jgi:hypothetical protein
LAGDLTIIKELTFVSKWLIRGLVDAAPRHASNSIRYDQLYVVDDEILYCGVKLHFHPTILVVLK